MSELVTGWGLAGEQSGKKVDIVTQMEEALEQLSHHHGNSNSIATACADWQAGAWPKQRVTWPKQPSDEVIWGVARCVHDQHVALSLLKVRNLPSPGVYGIRSVRPVPQLTLRQPADTQLASACAGWPCTRGRGARIRNSSHTNPEMKLHPSPCARLVAALRATEPPGFRRADRRFIAQVKTMGISSFCPGISQTWISNGLEEKKTFGEHNGTASVAQIRGVPKNDSPGVTPRYAAPWCHWRQ